MGVDYDPNKHYDEDTDYTIPGRLVNKISQTILGLREELANRDTEDMKKELEDLRLRDKNPALKDAWDQYQTVLKLTRENHNV